MNKKAAQLNVERQMADLEQSMTNTTRHERKIIRRALEIFSANLEFLPPDPTKNTTNAAQPQLNTGLLFDLKSVERII